MDPQLSTLALAYGADLLIGDPWWFPHPVRGMGLAIEWGERIVRHMIPGERLAGALLVAFLVGTSYAGTWWLLRASSAPFTVWGFLIGVILLFSCLSTRELAIESAQVLQALEAQDLPRARQRVARIVGRDTHRLDHHEVVRATLETIAESTLDGILSPLFYFVVGGVPLAVTYKTINTLDSMIGHRSARYIKFGWAAATLDTAANWIPARLSAVLFAVAARLCGCSASTSWRCAWSHHLPAPSSAESQNTPSCVSMDRVLRQSAVGRPRQVVGWRNRHSGGPVPNACIPEAAMAGALGVRLGGVNWYEGHAVQMPSMGDPIRPLEPQRIREALRLMHACSATGVVVALVAVLMRRGS